MDEDDLEDLWRDYWMRPKQDYQGVTSDGWWRWWWRRQSIDPPLGLLELQAGCVTLHWNLCSCLSKWCNIPGDSSRILSVNTAYFICQTSPSYKLSRSRPVWLVCHRLSPPFRVNSVTQFSPCVSAHTCSLHSPVSNLACQFAATACTAVKQMSRYQKRRCNAGSTPTGSSCSLPLNIARKSDTCIHVLPYVVRLFPFSRVIKSRLGD